MNEAAAVFELVKWFEGELFDLWTLSSHDGRPGALKLVNTSETILPGCKPRRALTNRLPNSCIDAYGNTIGLFDVL